MTVSVVSTFQNNLGGPTMARVKRLPVDPYVLAILTMVALASLFPAHGAAATGFARASTAAVALLFFLYGARLSVAEAVAGLRHWRLHLLVLGCTFVAFPLLGMAARALVPWALTGPLYLGVLFLCLLPSTVQSSIAFTSIAKGNVGAAICGASFSSLVGVLATPVLAAVLLGTGTGFQVSSIVDIVLQLLVPFAAGQLSRPLFANVLARNKKLLSLVDRGSILLVVYTAFGGGVAAGIWHQLSPLRLLAVVLVDVVLLALMLAVSSGAARALRFSREDRITVLFCGSKKSLVAGVPIASVLFGAHNAGLIVLPLMLFHQIQLMVCAVLARRYAAAGASIDAPAPAVPA